MLLSFYDASLSLVQLNFLNIRQGPKDVFLDYYHDFVQIWYYHCLHTFLVLNQSLETFDCPVFLQLLIFVACFDTVVDFL